ncbi:hypothetical protein [Pontibacter ruber]|uniref:Uncharacterized protein n=1 Tax=Pontibacter ruber TaxID=1343895 RepID=A0ABW5D042_9BACT|nr:hypothetical protein [Pontibacter ruber]
MKNILTQALLLCLFLSCAVANGQDIIIKKTGEEIIGKITRVDQDTVHYRHFNDTKGPSFYVLRQEVAQLRMATAVELPSAPQPVGQATAAAPPVTQPAANPAPAANNTADMMMRGKQDAYVYYKGKGVFWGTAGATILYPLAGLVGGIVTASIPPNIYESNPNYQLLNDPTYAAAYKKQAHKRKIGKAAAGFGVGMGALVVIYTIVLASIAGA